MLNKISEIFLKSFEESISLFTKFKKIENDKIYFVIKNEGKDKELVINIDFEEVLNKILPIFSFNSMLSSIGGLQGHVYGSGELCHNFVVVPIDKSNVTKLANQFSHSLIKYIKSLSIKQNIAISNLPEPELEKLEKLSSGFFSLLFPLDVHNELVHHSEKYIKVLKTQVPYPMILATDNRINHIFIPEKKAMESNVLTNEENTFIIENIDKNNITLKNLKTNKIEIVLKFHTNISLKQSHKNLKIAIIGLGSVGSCVLKLVSQDIDVVEIFTNDPDIYEPKNSFRSAFANSRLFTAKKDIALKKMSKEWARFYKIDGKLQQPKYNFLSFAIGYRLTQKEQKVFLDSIDKIDYILDCTGQEDVFNYLASNFTKPIFKIGLYSSGDVAIIGKYSNRNILPKMFSKQWENKRLELNVEIDSAYNNDFPATFNKTNLAAAVYYQFFKMNYPNLNENKIEVFNGKNLFKKCK